MVSKIFCNAAIAITGNIRHHSQIIRRGRARQFVHSKPRARANGNGAEGDRQKRANHRHHQIVGADLACNLADQECVQPFQIKTLIALRQLDKNARQRIKEEQRPCGDLERSIVPGRQDAIFIKQKASRADACKGKHKQSGRNGALLRFQVLIFPPRRQQINQANAGYRPHIQEHHDQKDQHKAPERLPERAG